MKRLSLFFLLFLAAFTSMAQPGNTPSSIQVAILFDTSNSMDGLIDQAKSRIWNIVNEIGELNYNGVSPDIQFALYHYGNDGLDQGKNYIEQLLDLTNDLDLVSEKLFGLSTNGGSEYCGAVIGRSLADLKWSTNPNDLRMIYIAGNEPFNQGPVDYKEVCRIAGQKGVFINTIYCGEYQQGIKEFWKDGADCSNGDYFNINSNDAIVHIPTPYDTEISKINDSLNMTYIGFGSMGMEKKANQRTQDQNAAAESEAVMSERAIVKSKGAVYKNSSWDLVDAVEEGKDINTIKDADLPDEFKGKSEEEKLKLIEDLKTKRSTYQKQIAELAVKRQNFIDDELKKRSTEVEKDDFGTSVNQSIYKKANEKGFSRNTNP